MAEETNVVSVTEITRRIKSALEAGFFDVWVQGEISNAKLHSSGHLYFTLKDENAQISAVMWRSRMSQLLFRPSDGMKVIVHGSISVYEQRGNYQIDCHQIQPVGVGELQLAFERLKKKLSEEGLFNTEHKKPLPQYPHRIGIVTSPTGAAIKDMVSILSRRFPAVELILVPVKVQGIGAEKEISEAIKDLNLLGEVDVIIVGRGGGSLEDLWAFNEEAVARAIYESAIPVISAVGHEIDYSISDFVADLRAPTPSAAAELVVKDKSEVVDIFLNFSYTIQRFVQRKIQSDKEKVKHLIESYSFNKPINTLRQASQRIDGLERRLNDIVTHAVEIRQYEVSSFQKRILALDPQTTLRRGYSIVYMGKTIVSSVSSLSTGAEVNIRFHDGAADAVVESLKAR